jgi:hypothetical protein
MNLKSRKIMKACKILFITAGILFTLRTSANAGSILINSTLYFENGTSGIYRFSHV